MQTRPTQPWLIHDLVPLILDSHDHWWTRDLLRLAIVSSAWVGPVRKKLYACPAVYSFRACHLLATSLKENQILLSLMQGINLRPYGAVSGKEMASLRFILSIEGLQSITLGGELAVAAERFLHSLTNAHTVTELCIDGNLLSDSIIFRPSLEWDEVMTFKFPSLKTLKLSNLDLGIIYTTIPFHLRITDLVLDNVNITSGYLFQILQASSSLQRLSLSTSRAPEFNEQIRLILDSCAIQTLRYEVREDDRHEPPVFDHDSSPCSSLRRLHLHGVHVDADTLASIGRCCRRLEEMIISGRDVCVTPDEWAAFLSSGTLPELRNLGMP